MRGITEIKNIILIGFMGTGKSSIGRLLAKELKWSFLDTDEIIEQNAGMSIRDIFLNQGEDEFRNVESDILQEVLTSEHQVIASGGGIVLRKSNVNLMKENGFIILLTATPEVIFQRTQKKATRPVLGEQPTLQKIKDILAYREPFYAMADWTIDTTQVSQSRVVQEILEYLKSKSLISSS